MVNVSGIGRPPPATAPRRTAAGSAGFAVSEQQAATGPAAAATAAAALDGLLQFQEVEDAPARDRQARRHGQALLRELGELQRLLLEDGPIDESLGRLAALVETWPEAADPALAGVVGAVALRARIELARRGR
jgi:hypothetical protein